MGDGIDIVEIETKERRNGKLSNSKRDRRRAGSGKWKMVDKFEDAVVLSDEPHR